MFFLYFGDQLYLILEQEFCKDLGDVPFISGTHYIDVAVIYVAFVR